jgi:hypothetical protein
VLQPFDIRVRTRKQKVRWRAGHKFTMAWQSFYTADFQAGEWDAIRADAELKVEWLARP